MTAVVVLGLLIQYIPELKDEWKKFLEAGAWGALTTRHSQAWKPLVILLGAVLVTGGVAGEMLFEGLSFHKEGQLEQANTSLNSFLGGEVVKAQIAADGAVADERQLKADLQQSKSDAEAAMKRLESEQQKTAHAQEVAAKAQLALREYIEQFRKAVGMANHRRKDFSR